jgi:uncharacterized protein (TIGR01777 family)
MKIVITGGTGLIGTSLANELVKENHEVIIFTRTPGKYSQKIQSNPRYVGWDIDRINGWSSWVNGTDAIINLAGENLAGDNFIHLIAKRWTKKQKEKILSSRVNAGKAITRAIEIAEQKPHVVIQASAVGYYGDRREDELYEDATPGDDFLARVCKQWENSTQDVEKLGVRHITIRTAGIVLSSRGGSLPFMILPFRFFLGGRLGNGRQWISWIHIADEINAIKYLMQNPDANGAYNLCAPRTYRNEAFSHILGNVLNRPSLIPLPAVALQLIFGEKALVLLSSQKQIPLRLQTLGYQFLFTELEAALGDIVKS